MRRAVVITLVLGAAAVAVAAAAPTGRGTETRPALRLVQSAPIALRGTHFRSGERVRISATSGRSAVKLATAGPTGTFVVRFTIRYSRCNGLMVVARGAKGSFAMLKRPMLQCRP
jgi:hypothetical protein